MAARRGWAVVGLGLLLVLPSGAWAHPQAVTRPASRNAQQPAATGRVEVLVIEASNAPGEIAPALAPLRQLREPPFSAFTSMRLMSRVTLALSAEPHSTPLPQGRGNVTVSLAGRSPEGRYTVDVRFAGAGATSNIQFVATEGQPFFTVRTSRPEQALIVGFIVR
ncbi:MAG: hypothetical protein JNK72_26675 [Myxococcales bacterium]|nr:hypothetical protein [Myxococcales bacterium]